jgi:putative acetyltransferase
MTTIREERPQDGAAINDVNERAFARATEADLVDTLRRACRDCLSLVAEDDEVVGHILFTPVTVSSPERTVTGMGLAPVAVAPERQRRGIGSALIEQGLAMLRERGCPFVVVLGHPEFYPRFGFQRASAHGLSCQWEGVPDEAFMVLILDARHMAGVSGIAMYRDEFDAAV